MLPRVAAGSKEPWLTWRRSTPVKDSTNARRAATMSREALSSLAQGRAARPGSGRGSGGASPVSSSTWMSISPRPCTSTATRMRCRPSSMCLPGALRWATFFSGKGSGRSSVTSVAWRHPPSPRSSSNSSGCRSSGPMWTSRNLLTTKSLSRFLRLMDTPSSVLRREPKVYRLRRADGGIMVSEPRVGISIYCQAGFWQLFTDHTCTALGKNKPRFRRTGYFLRALARSKRSRFITLSQAATKSRTNGSCESPHA